MIPDLEGDIQGVEYLLLLFYNFMERTHEGAIMDKPLWGLKVDGQMGRRFLRGLSLTAAMPLRVVVGRL